MIDLFTGVLGYTHVPDLGLDPTETQLTEHLRTLCRHHVQPEDHLVVYIAGYGEVLDAAGGPHVLLTADTDPDDVADALPTLRLANKMLLDTPVQWLLLLLDTCYSGSGGNQIAAAVLDGMEREWARSGSGLVATTSTQPFEQAETGAFPAGEVIVWDLRAGRMQASFAAPYPVGALSFDSDRGVVIGTATEIVRLQCGP